MENKLILNHILQIVQPLFSNQIDLNSSDCFFSNDKNIKIKFNHHTNTELNPPLMEIHIKDSEQWFAINIENATKITKNTNKIVANMKLNKGLILLITSNDFINSIACKQLEAEICEFPKLKNQEIHLLIKPLDDSLKIIKDILNNDIDKTLKSSKLVMSRKELEEIMLSRK